MISITTYSVVTIALLFFGNMQGSIAIVNEENVVEATARTVVISQNVYPRRRVDIEATSSRLLEAIQANGGCARAACFALDGSPAISETRYNMQATLAALIGSIISADTDSQVAAAEYSRKLTEITALTNDSDAFVEAMNNSTASARKPILMIAGVRFCINQIAASGAQRQALVVIGSGVSTIGNSPRGLLARSGISDNENVTLLPVLSTFGRRALVRNLGVSRSDVIVARNVRMIATALETAITRICNITML